MGMYTQLAGDAIDWPTLKATSGFGANVVVDGFPLSSDGKTRWNNNHAELNFHKSIRNLKIDVTAVDSGTAVSCINWPVAQATSLSSIVFNMNNNSKHLGVTFNAFQGGGSGIVSPPSLQKPPPFLNRLRLSFHQQRCRLTQVYSLWVIW
jgi:glucan 1,3-beta-glucosidase